MYKYPNSFVLKIFSTFFHLLFAARLNTFGGYIVIISILILYQTDLLPSLIACWKLNCYTLGGSKILKRNELLMLLIIMIMFN